jgi:fumarate reductase subunit D
MKKIIVSSLALAMPLMAAAATVLKDILITVRDLVNTIVPLFMVIAVAVFLWGIIRYITSAGDEEKQKTARGYIIYGLIGIFVMVAFWGIIQVVASTFGITPGGTIAPPTFNP